MTKGIRKLSDASPLVSAYLRDRVASDLRSRYDDDSEFVFLESMARHSLQLPDNPVSGWDTDVHFTDQRVLRGLEDSGQINWCPKITKLVPLAVPNDGNSLCHAASLALWGVADRNLVLRKALYDGLASGQKEEFRRRWADDWRKEHLATDSEVPEEEWETLTSLTTCENRSSHPNYPMYNPLDNIHVFVLANVLRRPIIVYWDSYTSGTHVLLGTCCGIHLPLLWSPSDCCRSPLLLGFSGGLFVPLVPACSLSGAPPSVSLVARDMAPMRVRFLKIEEQGLWEKLLVDYLDVDISRGVFKTASIQQEPTEETQRLVAEFFRHRGKNADGTNNNWNMNAVQDALPCPDRRRTSRFRCGNRDCQEFIEKDHTFPFCKSCYGVKGQADAGSFKEGNNNNDTGGAKRKTGVASVPVSSLGVDCATLGCPYSAAVNSFPYCTRCHEQEQATSEAPPRKEMKLEEKWMRLAMGIVDQEVMVLHEETVAVANNPVPSTGNEIVFPNEHCPEGPMDIDGELTTARGVTSPRSTVLQKKPPPRKSSATGLRSNLPPAPRKISKGEDASRQKNQNALPRKSSWTTEACASLGCPYFASLCCYPYCNQCANSAGIRRASFSAAAAHDAIVHSDVSMAT